MSYRIAILGLGLIGGSLARALAERMPDAHIAAFDLSHEALAFAAREGFIHSHHAHAGQAADGADLVVLAAPPTAFATLAADIAPFLKSGAVVTDAASVKRHAIAAIAPHLPDSVRFIPGHPIAGSEKSGVAASRADLFAGRRVILTPAEEELLSEPVGRVRMMWEAARARVEYMPADLHDRIYAYVSHLPQLVAFAAKHAMKGLPPAMDETGVRFARLMRSDPALWADICLANADYVGEALEDFATFAAQMKGELAEASAPESEGLALAATLFPRVVSTCLVATASLLQEITGIHPARYAGTGFADMTAPAVADPEATLAAISSHHSIVAKMLGELLNRLDNIHKSLDAGDRQKVITAS